MTTRSTSSKALTSSSEIKTKLRPNTESLLPNGLKLFTQTGYLMIVKSFTDDLSWAIQRELVTGYFAARRAGMTFMGTPVMPLADAARSLGLSPRTARERVMRGGFGMGDALLLEGRNFTRFKAENAQPHFPAKLSLDRHPQRLRKAQEALLSPRRSWRRSPEPTGRPRPSPLPSSEGAFLAAVLEGSRHRRRKCYADPCL